MRHTHICIFNPEHDLCLANGNAHYVPPSSSIDFARRDAQLMQMLYPDSLCFSVYDTHLDAVLLRQCDFLQAWGWDAVVKYELGKRGTPVSLLPSDETINMIRELQHRTTALPLQPDCYAITSSEEMERLLHDRSGWVLKAPWSGAGRGLRWVQNSLSEHNNCWLQKVVAAQRCVIAEPRRDVAANVALEYKIDNGVLMFTGYSYFNTGSGVYKENVMWTDSDIVAHFSHTELLSKQHWIAQWLDDNIVGRYCGPLGVDLMICGDDSIHVAEINFRHTMGMVAHEQIRMNNK